MGPAKGDKVRPIEAGTTRRDPEHRILVLAELERILESPPFRNSQQSQRLLRHLVERSLEGRFEELKERVIGVELFGRETGFDTNDDPIVRVRATEVRKRLSRYYEGLAEAPRVRLELPAGAYRVEFRMAQKGAGEAGETPRRRLRAFHLKRVGFGLLAAAAVGGAFLYEHRGPRIEDEFWAPVTGAKGKVIVCTGHPVVYRFTTDFLLRRGGADFLGKQTSVIELRPEEVISGRDVVAVPDQYIGLGSAHAVARIVSFLAQKGKESDIRFGDDISFTDLRQAPAVLVSFANRWVFDISRNLPLAPELGPDGRSRIVHRQTGQRWDLPRLQDNGRTDEDYILVTRNLGSESGQGLLVVAGLTQYGSQAAGEIVTNPSLLDAALANAKPGWQRRNLQMLFHVRVVNHTPGPPRLIAVYEW
jgi:hypothetical protein